LSGGGKKDVIKRLTLTKEKRIGWGKTVEIDLGCLFATNKKRESNPWGVP